MSDQADERLKACAVDTAHDAPFWSLASCSSSSRGLAALYEATLLSDARIAVSIVAHVTTPLGSRSFYHILQHYQRSISLQVSPGEGLVAL